MPSQAAQNDPRCASAAAGALAALLPLLPGAGRPGGTGGGGALALPRASAAAPAPPAELLAEARLSGVRRLLVSGALLGYPRRVRACLLSRSNACESAGTPLNLTPPGLPGGPAARWCDRLSLATGSHTLRRGRGCAGWAPAVPADTSNESS
jgi:hypothetical protein